VTVVRQTVWKLLTLSDWLILWSLSDDVSNQQFLWWLCIKVIDSQIWGIFWDTVYFSKKAESQRSYSNSWADQLTTFHLPHTWCRSRDLVLLLFRPSTCVKMASFLPRVTTLMRDIAIAILSVCSSVRPSLSDIVSKWLNIVTNFSPITTR